MITVKMHSSNTWIEVQMIFWEKTKYNYYNVIGIADVWLVIQVLFSISDIFWFTSKVSAISTKSLFTA